MQIIVPFVFTLAVSVGEQITFLIRRFLIIEGLTVGEHDEAFMISYDIRSLPLWWRSTYACRTTLRYHEHVRRLRLN